MQTNRNLNILKTGRQPKTGGNECRSGGKSKNTMPKRLVNACTEASLEPSQKPWKALSMEQADVVFANAPVSVGGTVHAHRFTYKFQDVENLKPAKTRKRFITILPKPSNAPLFESLPFSFPSQCDFRARAFKNYGSKFYVTFESLDISPWHIRSAVSLPVLTSTLAACWCSSLCF